MREPYLTTSAYRPRETSQTVGSSMELVKQEPCIGNDKAGYVKCKQIQGVISLGSDIALDHQTGATTEGAIVDPSTHETKLRIVSMNFAAEENALASLLSTHHQERILCGRPSTTFGQVVSR